MIRVEPIAGPRAIGYGLHCGMQPVARDQWPRLRQLHNTWHRKVYPTATCLVGRVYLRARWTMKTLRAHRLFAVLAMWLLLLGTAAPALERLRCSMGCPTTVGIGTVEDCCPEGHDEHGSAIVAGDCCDVERTAPEHHAFTAESGSSPIDLLASASERSALSAPIAIGDLVGYGLSSRPPPLLTTERLSRTGRFLI